MTRARDLATVGAHLLWWSPALALAIILTAPHVVALYGIPYRLRRVRRLCQRLQVDEAERVTAAVERDARVAQRWCAGLRP